MGSVANTFSHCHPFYFNTSGSSVLCIGNAFINCSTKLMRHQGNLNVWHFPWKSSVEIQVPANLITWWPGGGDAYVDSIWPQRLVQNSKQAELRRLQKFKSTGRANAFKPSKWKQRHCFQNNSKRIWHNVTLFGIK